MALYAVDFTFTSDTARRDEVRPSHREYLKELLDGGKLYESGPYVGEDGALIVYIADSVADVQELMAADPYAKNGIIAGAAIHEWNVVMSNHG